MKKIMMLVLLVLGAFTLASCTKPVEEDPPVNVRCDLFPDHEDCKEPVDVPDDEFFYCKEEACNEVIENYIQTLTISEKAGQMLQAERQNASPYDVKMYNLGSILSGGGSHPDGYQSSVSDWYDMYEDYQEAALDSSGGIPIIYGIDAVHGNNNLYGATIFPHNIGLGAANDPELMYEIGRVTAREMLVTGINYNFSPAFSVVQNIRWGRTYEAFSENPEIHVNLAQQAILGLEENGVSATAKHFLGDGGTVGGQDQGNVIATEEEIRELYLAAYYEAIEAEVDSIMISYSSINGLKMHGSEYWITDVLKVEMGFEGFVISDYEAIKQLPGSYKDQIARAINSGIDMLMEPISWKDAHGYIIENYNSGAITEDRINDAVRRILTVKYYRGILDDPTYQLDPSVLYSQEHRDVAREAVRKSLVLLENDNNSLPLTKDQKIFVTGPGANSIALQNGGWSTYWQGAYPNFWGNPSVLYGNDQLGAGIGIKDAMEDVLSSTSGMLVNNVNDADTVVVVLAETPYAEYYGDNDSMTLTTGNAHSGNAAALQVAAQAQAAGKNVVGILISGRPLLITDELSNFDSFVAAWLPGSEGGNGINDVLFGDYDFTGILPVTWPATLSQVGITSNDSDYNSKSVLYRYGYGLSYDD